MILALATAGGVPAVVLALVVAALAGWATIEIARRLLRAPDPIGPLLAVLVFVVVLLLFL